MARLKIQCLCNRSEDFATSRDCTVKDTLKAPVNISVMKMRFKNYALNMNKYLQRKKKFKNKVSVKKLTNFKDIDMLKKSLRTAPVSY